MLQVSDDAKKYIESDTRTFHARLLLDGEMVSGEIRSLTINKGSCGSSDFVPGSVFSSYIDVTLDGCDQKLEGKELTAQIGTVMEDVVEWTTVGFYTVDKPSTTAYSTSFSGLGRISSKMGGLYSPSITFPATVKAVLAEISEKTGVEIDAGELDASIKIETQPSGYLYREMLSFIAGLYFGYATESADGTVTIRQYQTEATATTDGDRTTELPTFQDLDAIVTGVKVVIGSLTDSEGNSQDRFFTKGTVNVAVSNPFMTQAIFDKYVDSIIGFQYRPATATVSLGDFRLEASDVLGVTDIKGTTVTVPCMSVVHTFDGGIRTVITAPAIKSTGEDTQAYRGPLSQAMSVMQAQLLIVGNIVANALTVDKADIRYATIENLKAMDAEIENLKVDYGEFKKASFEKLEAQDADIKNLNANKLEAKDADIKYANIDFSNIKKAAIEQFYATSGIIKDLVIGDQTVTGELIGVTISGDLIKSNTIVADKIVVKGEDGLYYKLNTDGTTVEKEQTDYNSLNGQVIQAKSVTAEKINVKDLVAFDATIGGITISDNSIYSGVKESALNTTRGFYFGKDGQVAFGDTEKYLRYYFTEDDESVFELYSKNFSIDADGNAKFSGTIDGAGGTFAGNLKSESIIAEAVNDNSSLYLKMIDNNIKLGNSLILPTDDEYEKHIGSSIGIEDNGGLELRSFYTINETATGEQLGRTHECSITMGDGIKLDSYYNGAITLFGDNILLNGTDWDDFLNKHPYDWSTFGTADNTHTWMPVVNGGKVYHRDVAATFSQANWWLPNSALSTRWTCLKLSNNIVIYFAKGDATFDVNKTAAKGYNSGEHILTLPSKISTILYASSYVENNNNWENVELKIHYISSTQIKNHFWCQNSYSNLHLYWYVMLVAQL